MNEQLFVNGFELDIEPQSIARKIRATELGNVANKKSNISIQFKILRTIKNSKALGLLGVAGSPSKAPYSELRVNYIVDTIPVIIDGLMIVEKTDSMYYYVRIYDGLLDLSSKLKGRRLKDLPLSDLDHYLNAQNIEDSFSNTEGYIYALGDYGQGLTQSELLAPSFFVHTIWSKIFNSAGVQFDGAFFSSDDEYLSEVITPSIGYTPIESTLSETAQGSASSDIIDRLLVSDSYINLTDKHNFTGSGLVDFTISGGNLVSGVSGRVELDIATSWNNVDTDLFVRLTVNDVTKTTIYLEVGGNLTKNTNVVLNLNPGDVIKFHVVASSYYQDGPVNHRVDYRVENDVVLTESSNGFLIEAANIIGEMTQLDFVRDIINRYGLFPIPVSGNTNAYRFRTINEILSNRSSVEDWTSKLVDPGSEAYDSGLAKNNYFKYQYPRDVIEKKYDGVLTVDNFNAEEATDLYKSPFEIPSISTSYFSNPIYQRILFELNSESEIEAKEAPNSVMSLKRVNGTYTIRFFNDTPIGVSGSIPLLSLENMGMQRVIDRRYSQYVAMVNQYNSKEISLNLSTVDIHGFKLDKLYYFAQLGKYYLVNELTHRAGGLSTAIVTQIAEIAENEPPTSVGSFSFDMPFQGTKAVTSQNLLSGYSDPEYDEPKEVRILSGWGNEIEIRQAGTAITAQTDIPIGDLDLTIVDTSSNTSERSRNFTFTISDMGSGEFSSEIGTISATAKAYTPKPVTADAGPDQDVIIDRFGSGIVQTGVSASGSSSLDQITSYFWEITTKPGGSSATISNGSTGTPSAVVNFPNDVSSTGYYILRVTVTTEFGVTDTDEMQISVTDF